MQVPLAARREPAEVQNRPPSVLYMHSGILTYQLYTPNDFMESDLL